MKKGNHKHSLLPGNDKYCWVTGARNVPLEKHHIYFGPAKRKVSDRWGCWVWLTPELHRGTAGVHGRDGHGLDLRLKQECQRAFEEWKDRNLFMETFGRNYLEE
jgi:hypothetical protein